MLNHRAPTKYIGPARILERFGIQDQFEIQSNDGGVYSQNDLVLAVTCPRDRSMFLPEFAELKRATDAKATIVTWLQKANLEEHEAKDLSRAQLRIEHALLQFNYLPLSDDQWAPADQVLRKPPLA